MFQSSLLRKISVGAVVLTGAVACQRSSNSDTLVTNGAEETGFSYVVQIKMDGSGTCTGSFVSDSLLVTAAHCVQKAKKVAYGNVEVDRGSMFIHPMWPSRIDNCNLPSIPKYDLALVRFPANTYTGSEYAKLASRTPKVDESFKIVGFGHSVIEPFEKFCRLPQKANSDGMCAVQVGNKVSGSRYTYGEIFNFEPVPTESAGCPVDCSRDTLRQALLAEGKEYTDFVANECGGNFRDRPYKESGVGTRRSGTNKVQDVGDGTIVFRGALGGEATGENSASGAGDSGGPLFIMEDGAWRIAAVTHGGNLVDQGSDLLKRSVYVDLNASHNTEWLKMVVKEERLSFPGLHLDP